MPRPVVVLLVASALVGGFWFFTDDVGAVRTVEIPPAGQTIGAVLRDGTPVLVATDDDGSPTVWPAVFDDAPLTELVAWCPGVGPIASHLGVRWDRRGVGPSQLRGRLPGDAVLSDLPRFQTGERSGTPSSGGRVQLLSAAVRPGTGPISEDRAGIGAECLQPSRALMVVNEPDLRPDHQPISHVSLAAPLLMSEVVEADGWRLTSGTLDVDADGTARWCLAELAPNGSCAPADAGPEVSLDLSVLDTVGGSARIIGPAALRFDSGVIVQVAALPEADWRGASLRGGTTFDATFGQLNLPRSLVSLTDVEEPRPRCVFRLGDGADSMRGLLGVTRQTAFDLDGRFGTTTIAVREPADVEGLPVRVQVDAGTCTALSIRSR